MKHLALSVIPLLAVLSSVAPGQITFQRTYGGPYADRAWSVAQTADGGYIIAGYTWSYGSGECDVLLIKTDALGDTIWTRTFGGVDYDYGYSVAQTTDGGYVIAGCTQSFDVGWDDIWLIRTNPSGDSLWTRTFGGAAYDGGRSVTQTRDGGCIIVGGTESYGAGSMDAWLIKTNPLGDTLWTRTFGGALWEHGYSGIQTADGGYAIVGYTLSFGAGRRDVWLIRTDSLGDTLWTRTYGGIGDEFGYSVAQTWDGGYVITGYTYSFGAGRSDVWLIKTDAAGDTVWTRTFGGDTNDFGSSVAQTADGGYVVVGSTESFGAGATDAWLIKTDPSGNTLWTRTFGGTGRDWGYSVARTADNGYVITGEATSPNIDFWLIKTDSLGRVGVAEPRPPAPVTPAQASLLPRARLMFELRQDPNLALFDASGRRVLDPTAVTPGILFLRSAATTRRVLVVE